MEDYDYPSDDPMHGAHAEAMRDAQARQGMNAAEAYVSSVQLGPDANTKRVGPKTVAKQIPVPPGADPMGGLRCTVCKSQAVGFVVRGSFPVASEPSIADSAKAAESRLAESLYAGMDGNDLELATKYGFPVDRLAHGLIGGKPGVATQAPQPHSEPRCLKHMHIAANVAEKPVQPLGVDALDHASHWRLVGGWDNLFCTVVDKHGTMARISPRDYKAHTGVLPGAS